MKERHWKRIEEVTKWSFDVESEGFYLRNVMEAPLLQNMEDIEVSIVNYFFFEIFYKNLQYIQKGHLHKCCKREGHRSKAEADNC